MTSRVKRIASSGRLPKRRERIREREWEGGGRGGEILKEERGVGEGKTNATSRWLEVVVALVEVVTVVVEVARTPWRRRRHFSPIKAAVECGSRSFYLPKEDTWIVTTWICAWHTSFPRVTSTVARSKCWVFLFLVKSRGIFFKSSPWTREQPSTWSPRVKNGECSTIFLLSSIGYLYWIIRKIKWYECFLIFLSKLS